MTPEFLRAEAARFRGMADTAEREASKLRLLKMAADYESQAKATDGLPEQDLPEPTLSESTLNQPIKVEPSRKTARKPSEAV